MKKEYDIKVIAKRTRTELKAMFPSCKFSVRIERYTGGQSLYIALMSAPFKAIRNGSDYEQVNHYHLHEHYDDYIGLRGNIDPTRMTFTAWQTMRDAIEIAQRDNWDNSDIQVDYFDVNYYLHVSIGQWDKPYKQTA